MAFSRLQTMWAHLQIIWEGYNSHRASYITHDLWHANATVHSVQCWDRLYNVCSGDWQKLIVVSDRFTLSALTQGWSLIKMAAYWYFCTGSASEKKISQLVLLYSAALLLRNQDEAIHESLFWINLLSSFSRQTLSLNFQKSQLQLYEALSSHQQSVTEIEWLSDVDSFIAHATTLTVHWGGFCLSYLSSFLHCITQNQQIKVSEHSVHKLKQLCLS